MKPSTRVIPDDPGSKSKNPPTLTNISAQLEQKFENRKNTKNIEDTKGISVSQNIDILKIQINQAGATTVKKCTCDIDNDTWDLDEDALILNSDCTVCKVSIDEVTRSEIIETNTEILQVEDGFGEVTLGRCLACGGPARVCGCVDANLQVPFDHERDDHGFSHESQTTVVPRTIRALELEVDAIFDPMSDGCTDTLRRMTYDREPNERVEIDEVGYTFIDHHKKK